MRMARVTDWTYRPGRGEAEVVLYEPSQMTEGRPVAVVSWKGDEHLVPHVPAAYFDKIFSNLRGDDAAAQDLLERVVRFVHETEEGDTDSLLAGFADYDRLAIPGKGGVPLPAPAVREEFAGKPMARVKAKMVATNSVLGATTHFKPRLGGQNPTVAEYGFWALWDWMILFLLQADEYPEVARSYNSFAYQLSLYQAHGVPGFTEMGVSPLVAVTAVANRDETIDVHYLIGRVRHELADIATAEDGTPLIYPKWILRQFVKMQILLELGLLEPEIMALYETQREAGGPAEQEAASGPYTAALDQVIEENDLASVVEEVTADVTTTDPSDLE